MFLSIDVGNSQTTLGLFEGEKIIHAWRMSSSRSDTADMLHQRLAAYFQKDGLELASVTRAGLSSVVPSLTRAWEVCLTHHCKVSTYTISAPSAQTMPLALPFPSQIGADRIANAYAALASYGAPVIVVDFGTATNIDVVDAQGTYRGGCIAPGLIMGAEALFSKAARLASVPIEAPSQTLGTTTETAVQAGLVIGAAAMAEGLINRLVAELEKEAAPTESKRPTIVATGGLAATVAQATSTFDIVDQDITLRGIKLLADENAELH